MSISSLNDFFDDMLEDYEIDAAPVGAASAEPMQQDAAKALACCVDTMGYVNLPWMSDKTGLTVRALTEALEDSIYQDPEAYDLHRSEEEDWLLRAQYVSGSITDKLAAAERMNQKYPDRFSSNVRVLKAAMPARVPFEEIGIGIGSAWVPAAYYSQFARALLGTVAAPEVFHSPVLGQWRVEADIRIQRSFNNLYTYGYSYKNRGTTKFVTMLNLLEHTLNGSAVKVYEQVDRPDRKSGKASILLRDETVAAQEKQELLRKAFQEWVVKDPKRVQNLERIFHDALAASIISRFNGDFLTFPGLNPEFTPYRHQRDAVARIVLEKDVLLNHAVGTGKTSILIMGIHERYRMGLSRKNLVVVPNNVLEAFEREHRFLYPEDRILVIRPEEFRPAARQALLERVRDEDFTAVYMAFSSFGMIRMSSQYRLEQKEKEIDSCRAMAASAQYPWERKEFARKADKLCEELQKLRQELCRSGKRPEDTLLPFDRLGITTLAVDEIHNFKNITLRTSADGVVGLHTAGSVKCNEMMEKAQYVRSSNGSLLLSTGTPLTNSIADLFVLQMFLQPEQMRMLKLGHFDEWVGTFGSRQTGFEVDVDSQSYRIMTRFSSFHNLPELTGLFASVCDYYNGSERQSGLPECDGYIDTVVPRSPEQSDYIEELVLRTEMIRAKLVRGDEDNLLKVTHDGRAAALDIRLADPKRNPDPKSTKAYACAENVYSCWKKYPGTAQLVFCDLGTPKKGFNIYDALKNHLIRLGIPEHQIAFAQNAGTDAKRRKLFAAVNRAEVRVLIGSTSTLGTGVNVQENLVAVHHLDVCWKPAELIQREGRLIRQGNRNSRVFRYRYITAGTFDAYSWQVVENKQRIIGRFMSGALADRESRDIDEAVLSYAEIKALSVGDPLLKTRIETGNSLERAKIHCRRRNRELQKMKSIFEEHQMKLDKLSQTKSRLTQDRRHFEKYRESLTRRERLAFGEELLAALETNAGEPGERRFDHLHGFSVLLPADMKAEKPHVLLAGKSTARYEVDMRETKAAGCIQRIEYVLLHLGDRIRSVDAEIARIKSERSQAAEELRKGNPYTEEVEMLSSRLLDIDQELNRRAEESAA